MAEEDEFQSDDEYGPAKPLPEGIQKEIIKDAESTNFKRPKKGDEITVHYVGTFQSDGKEFDNSRKRDQPAVFTLGQGQVIKGWDLGIRTMRKGEVAKFTFQPQFAYGEAGTPPVIPPNAVLIFEVELISWVSKDDLFGDGGCQKARVKEGSGWQNPKAGDEICISLKVTASGGAVLMDKVSIDYFVGSDVLGPPTAVVEKALSGMCKDEQVVLRCIDGYVYPVEQGHGDVVMELTLEEMYEIADVSLLKDGSTMKKQVREGEGHDRPRDGHKVVLRVESATDGAQPLPGFTGPKELKFRSGDGEVCDVLEGAAREMKRGERSIVTSTRPQQCCEASLGLSDIKAEKVVFVVELLDLDKGRDLWSMSGEEKVLTASARKEMGARLFKQKRFELALDKYKKVIELCNQTDKMSDECKAEAAELKRASELNKSACYLQLGDNMNALSTCNLILREDRFNVKALFRRGKAHHNRGEYVDAERDLEAVLALDSGNSEAKALLPHVRRAQKVADKESKSTYAKMCQGFGKLGKENKQPQPQPSAETAAQSSETRNMDMVSCTFRIEHKTEPGESLCVVGAPDALGAWDLSRSVQMKRVTGKINYEALAVGKEQPPCHIWEVAVDLSQAEGRAEYKYVVRGPTGDRPEDGNKHAVQLGGMGGSRVRCSDEWRKAEGSS
mmetsp:Transcript_15389/g.33863  ORF Transcript_15389/g.33863 Transcript_15389/m.33863 type:complete len:672 (-) Transcript_15389:131-2146(-)